MRFLFLSLFCMISFLKADKIVEKSFTEKDLYSLGKSIYEETCISCHGEHGETNADIHLIVKPRKLQKTLLSEKQSFEIIKHGAHYFGAHADIMPTFKYVYNDKKIAAVARYISVAFNAQRDVKLRKLLDKSIVLTKEEKQNRFQLGKKIFLKKCAKCHGVTGNAQSEYIELSKENKNFIYPYNLTRTLLDEEQIFLYAKYGGHYWGTDKKDMPAWKDKYNDVILKSVAYYIHKEIKKIKD